MHPLFIPDESGYLLAARFLAGGPPGDLSGRVFYQAGYPLLISPAYWLSQDPPTVYRLVLVINAMIGACLLPLAFVGLRRFGLSRVQAYAIAMLTALLPSGIYYSQFAMTDALLPTVVLGWLLCAHSWLTTGRPGYGVAASALAAYTSCVHVRGAIIVLVHAGLLVAVFGRRRVGRPGTVLAGGALAGVAISGAALNDWVRAWIYPGGVLALDGHLSERLTSVDGMAWTLALAAGKIWYLVVSTLGVAGVGLIVLGALAVRRDTDRATRVLAWLVLATTTGIALATSAAVPDEGSVANLAYGRYLSPLVPVLFMAGAVAAIRSTERAAALVLTTAGLTASAAGAVWLYARGLDGPRYFASFDFPELCFLTWSWDRLSLWAATGIALSFLALAGLLIAKGREAGAAVIVAALAAFGPAVGAVVTDRVTDPWDGRLSAATSLRPAGLTAEDRVAVHYPGLEWRVWVSQAFQVGSGLRPMERDRPETLPPDTTLVVVPWDVRTSPTASWPAAPANWRPASLRSTPTGAWVAWRRAEWFQSRRAAGAG